MSKKINIDEVSAEVKALISAMKLSESSAAQDRKLAQPKLQLIWKALEAKQPVSGCKSKGEWAKYAGVTTRYCQYILKDGTRKRTEKKDANPVRIVTLKPGTRFKVEGSDRVFEIPNRDDDFDSDDSNVSIKRPWERHRTPGNPWLGVKFTNVTIHAVILVGEKKEEKTAPKKKDVVRHIQTKATGAASLCGVWPKNKTTEKHPANCKKCIELQAQPEPSEPTIDPAKDLMKWFRAAKRAAKFYVGMMKEWEVSTSHGKRDYTKLLSLWGGEQGHGYPWTPPTPEYRLPKTADEFQTEYDKATGEFHAVLTEVEAMGVLTTEPRKKKEMSEPQTTPTHAKALVTHARVSPRKTLCEDHIPNRHLVGRRTFAEKWEDASCPDCMRFKDVTTSVENPLCKLRPADREWLEKRLDDHRNGISRESACPEREPEYESLDPRRHFPTDAQRRQSELFNACGNLDGDDKEAL